MMTGYGDFPIVRQTFVEGSDVLGEDFWALVNNGPADRLNQTINTQPLMLIAGIAVSRLAKPRRPTARVAGRSQFGRI